MKKLISIIAIITLLGLVVGIISFSFNELGAAKKLLAESSCGDYEDIEYYPIYDWIKYTGDQIYENVDNLIYNIDYIINNMF
ncbi:MAG: hypothetical protein ACLSBL_03775 [Ezakiella massiliensis]